MRASPRRRHIDVGERPVDGAAPQEDDMPMIDVYAAAGTFADPKTLARDLATALMKVEQVPDIMLFRKNTAAFVRQMPVNALSNVAGDADRIRIQVLTNAGALDREKQLAAVAELTRVASEAANDPALADRTWVLLTEAPDGGWGIGGHAYLNEELIAAARTELGRT
jgi:phenylpyruvate tautomerase PptA (4-oxalocrotonate tautomerase family)